MAHTKSTAKKKRLIKAGKQTKWAPVWLIPKMHKGLKKIHPSSITRKKRHWRGTKIKP